MRRITTVSLCVVVAATLATSVAGCREQTAGPQASGTTSPDAMVSTAPAETGTPTAVVVTPQPDPSTSTKPSIHPSASTEPSGTCPTLPHGWSLCMTETEGTTWVADLAKNDAGVVSGQMYLNFSPDGTVSWSEMERTGTTETARGDGTWTLAGDTVTITFPTDTFASPVIKPTLSLKFGEFQRMCDTPTMQTWDDLVSTDADLPLRFEPNAC